MTALTARFHRAKEPPPLVNGKPIRNRLLQQILWSIGLGTVVFGLFASGSYFGPTQVHWYIHIGSFYWPGFWLKHGWDSGMGVVGPHTRLINLTNWTTYRHNYRDIGLPALATMGAFSIAGGARKPAGRLYTAIAPFLVLAVAVVLITVASYVELATVAHATSLTVRQTNLVHLGEALLFGFLIGKVLHYIWRPAGTRIQGFLVERGMDRFYRSGGTGLPVWIRKPVAPPTLREAGQKLATKDEASGEAQQLRETGHTGRSTAIYWLVGVGVVLVLGVDFVGFIGHIWDGVLHLHFPYLAP